MNKNIVLVGFMGTGKTTVGRRLANHFGLDFFDTDEYVKKCENMSVSDIVTKKGRTYFEGAESFAVMNLLENENALIATGGGTLKTPQNFEKLKSFGTMVWLRVSPETIFENTKNSHNKRLELVGKNVEEIASLMKEYEAEYALSDIIIDIDERNLEKVIETVKDAITNYWNR